VVQSLGGGDVLLQPDGNSPCFVMRFGRGVSDGSGTNAWLIKEGVKSLRTPAGEYTHAEAFTSVSLSKEETAALDQVVAALRRKAAALNQDLARTKGTEGAREFQDLKARASDSNPYLQYLLARAYLEGKGTDKDEKLGLTWMKKAAQNGSGDATAYLEKLQSKPPR
jgi:TPR repeat protein